MNVYDFLKQPTTEVYSLPHITLDLETTNKSYGASYIDTNRVLSACYWDGQVLKTERFSLSNIDRLIILIEQLEGFLVGHNIKFDLKWLARYGLDLTKVVVWDTMIGEHVIYGNRSPTIPVGLGPTAIRYGMGGKDPYVDLCMKGSVCPSELPYSMLEARVKYDVTTTENVFRAQYKLLEERDQLKTMLTRCLLTPVLADMEAKGIFLDADKVREEYAKSIAKKASITAALRDYGDINWNSGLQVGNLIYDELGFNEALDRQKKPIRTATGRRKADVGTIRKLTARTKKQKILQTLLSDNSIVEAQLTKTLNKFKECVDNDDLLYAQFNQAVTQTHRLSSSGTEYGVQFQNMPRIYKPCVKARNEGWYVAEADGAQLEFRVAAFLGQDEQAIHDIVEGTDIHQYTADTITSAGQAIERQEAKAHTFKPLFGGRSGTKAEKAYYQAFKEKYKGVAQTQERWKTEAMIDKHFTIPSGLKFYFPNIRPPRGKDGYIPEESNIYNYPIQSFATADIIPIAIVYLWHEMKNRCMESFLINTVHDSVIAELKPKEKEEFSEIALDSFGNLCYNYLKVVYNVEFNVPLGCGIKIGNNWGTGREITTDLPSPYKF